MTVALRTEGLTKAWGRFVANDDVALSLPVGARHALIGPNGAGKTTLVNMLAGVLAPTRGDVWLGDARITRLTQHERVQRGLARTFQVTNLFPGLTALESVVLAVSERTGTAWNGWRRWQDCRAERDEAEALLEGMGLAPVAGT